jgi:hypothetical protein
VKEQHRLIMRGWMRLIRRLDWIPFFGVLRDMGMGWKGICTTKRGMLLSMEQRNMISEQNSEFAKSRVGIEGETAGKNERG